MVDISSESDVDSRVSVTSSTLRLIGLEAYPANEASSAAPVTPTSTPTSTPPHTPVHTTSWTRPIRIDSIRPHIHPTDEAEPSGHPHVPPYGTSSYHQPSRPFSPSPPHVTCHTPIKSITSESGVI
ncbi:hypothetical protein Hanom_Chr07g00623231 [Helianthus anomalus]